MKNDAKKPDREVDLAALVDVLSNMLFFLLATTALIHMRTLGASIPAEGTPTSGTPTVVSVVVSEKGYQLEAKHGVTIDVSVAIPRTNDGALDTARLSSELWKIKQASPETRDIMVAPGDAVVFDEIVQTMDASREIPSVSDARRRVPMFTRPVLVERT